MLDPETVEISGLRFQLLPMPLMEAQRWDRKLLQIIAPVLGALDGVDLSAGASSKAGGPSEPDELTDVGEASEAPESGSAASVSGDDVAVTSFASVAQALGTALRTLSDAEQAQFIRAMLKNVTYLGGSEELDGAGEKSQLLDSETAINRVLTGTAPLTLYLLIFHVARYNKFTPFALAAAGAKNAAFHKTAERVARGIISKTLGA